jgi:hypothetical protein
MDYKQKYLKYKKKYVELKNKIGSSLGNDVVNNAVNNIVNIPNVIQSVLNINPQHLQDRKRQLEQVGYFGNDPLNRPNRPVNFFPPNPEEGRPIRRQWGVLNSIEEEDADNERKRYLLENHYKVNWGMDNLPPSWWPFNS